MKNRILFISLSLSLLNAATCLGQSASLTTGADFLLAVPGARPAGMGQAFTALADDVNALNFNPAGLAQIQEPEVGYGRYQFVSDVSYDFLGAAYPLGEPGVLGLGFLDSQTAPFNSTPDPNAPLVNYSDMTFLLAYGRALGPLEVGGTLKFVLRQVGDIQGTGFLGDLGVRYQALPRLVLAAAFQNLGSIQILSQESATPTLGRIGLAWRCLSTPFHTLDLAMDCNYDPNTQLTRLGWGAEYWYQGLFALRAGYVGNSEEEGPTFGAGIRSWGFQLDYAYEPLNVLGSTQRLSLTAYLGPGKGAEIPQPTHLEANPSNDGLMLSWNAPSFTDIQGYRVYVKRPGSDSLACLTSQPITETSVDLKHLKIGEDYEFGVSTLNTTGQESPLNRIELVAQEPVLSAPTGFKAWKEGDNVVLTWDKVIRPM